jgi:hypothetical protein
MKELSGFILKDTDKYNHAIKRLKKRFAHIESDCQKFIDSIKTTDDLGVHLGNNTGMTPIS